MMYVSTISVCSTCKQYQFHLLVIKFCFSVLLPAVGRYTVAILSVTLSFALARVGGSRLLLGVTI